MPSADFEGVRYWLAGWPISRHSVNQRHDALFTDRSPKLCGARGNASTRPHPVDKQTGGGGVTRTNSSTTCYRVRTERCDGCHLAAALTPAVSPRATRRNGMDEAQISRDHQRTSRLLTGETAACASPGWLSTPADTPVAAPSEPDRDQRLPKNHGDPRRPCVTTSRRYAHRRRLHRA